MKIYFDNAATTRVRREVLKQMIPFLSDNYGNPSSIHYHGRKAKVAIEAARESIAGLINCDTSEVYFTSGGTEANNFAIRGIAAANFTDTGKTGLICSRGEHHCVLDTIKYLAENRFETKFVNLTDDTSIDLGHAESLIDENTSLLAVMHTNNETGAINPIETAAALKGEKNFFLHSDAVQGFGKSEIDVQRLNVDSLALSAHKIGGPKGVGAAFIRNGTPVQAMMTGGSQERNRRGGTENVAGIAGLAAAAKLALQNLETNRNHAAGLRQSLAAGLKSIDPENISFNDSPHVSPFILSVTLNPEVYRPDAEALMMYLDINGVAASNGAACSSGALKPSHVMLNSGRTPQQAAGTIRFSFSRDNTAEEVEYALEVMQKLTKQFRKN